MGDKRAPKRTFAETHDLTMRLKGLLISAAPTPLSLAAICAALNLEEDAAARLLKQIEATRSTYGHYTYVVSQADIDFAIAVYQQWQSAVKAFAPSIRKTED